MMALNTRILPSWGFIAAINLLLPIGILWFAKGFFPYKPFLPGLSSFVETDDRVTAPFNKVIFMVVDALRSDFVYGERSGFTFTQSLIRDGFAMPFTAHATSPTITMPRVKAITTGSIPGFLDVILNFAESDTSSSLAQQDNWLAQIKARGGKLVMYGDDTWIKLFPGMFDRSDGTTSFFVSDFTEVDNNVTRHIDNELMRDDWDAMVLHYLGLDHIGHKSGPQSVFMLPKQVEMDGIVKRIYNAMETQSHLNSTLFVLVGDHGMNDAGNHGGSGPGETSPALLFLSPKIKTANFENTDFQAPTSPNDGGFGFYEVVEQSDIAPTLSAFLGLPIPMNNLGVVIPRLLKMFDSPDRVHIMMQNIQQLQAIAAAAYPEFEYTSTSSCNEPSSDLEELACLWQGANRMLQDWKNPTSIHGDDELYNYLGKICVRYQQILSGVASNYDLQSMSGGMGLILIACILSIGQLVPTMSRVSIADWSFPLMSLLYCIMMFASSYVEEEHHFWYWMASAWFMALFFKQARNRNNGLGVLFIFILLRIARRWNQTGQKHAGAPDIVKSFFPENPSILWVLIVATYFDVFLCISRTAFRRIGGQAGSLFAFTTVVAAFTFKLSYAAHDAKEMVPFWLMPIVAVLNEVPLVNQAKAVFGMVITGMIYTCFFELSPSNPSADITAATVFTELTNVFLLTQTRFANTPLILFFRLITRRLISSKNLTASEITITILILQYVSFFALGGANAISSVDLSNAYNGVSGYNILFVGFLTFIGNWAGPVYWASAAPIILFHQTNQQTNESFISQGSGYWKRHVIVNTVFHCAVAVAVTFACTALRTHLFIWTVFSPKYLYTMVWTSLFHILVGVCWGSVLMWLGENPVAV